MLALLLCLAPLPNPDPDPKSGKPITAANADKVVALNEVDLRAYRLTRGPRRGEMTLYDYYGPGQVIDDATLRSRRKVADGLKLADLTTSRDGKLVAWLERGKGYTLLSSDGKKTAIEVADDPGYAAFSPDGKLLAIGKTFWDPRAEGEGHSETLLFDTAGKLLRTLERSGAGAVRPVFSPDGKTLAVGNRNHEPRLFDVATGKLLHTLGRRMTQEIAFSPDGRSLAAAYVDGTVAVWDVATGKLVHSVASGCSEVYCVDWSPKGDVLASSGLAGKVVLWDPKGMTKLKELDSPMWVIQVRFVADGSRLIMSSSTDHGSTGRKVSAWGLPEAAKRP